MNMDNSFATQAEPFYPNAKVAKDEVTEAGTAIKANGKFNGSKNIIEHQDILEDTEIVAPKRRGRKRGSTNAVNSEPVEGRRRKRDSEVLVGERIRRLRTEAGLSQEELGRSSKMSTSYISRLETGEVNPTVDALTRIVRVFSLSIDGLLELDTTAPTMLAADEMDPEIRVLLFKLKGKKVSARTKRIIQAVIKEELEENQD